jgi:hypothetical protein
MLSGPREVKKPHTAPPSPRLSMVHGRSPRLDTLQAMFHLALEMPSRAGQLRCDHPFKVIPGDNRPPLQFAHLPIQAPPEPCG